MFRTFRRPLVLVAAATVAIAACTTSTPAAPALTDAREILTRSIGTFKDVKSLHLHADVSGQVKIDLSGKGNGGAVDLKGTTADGDIDITNKKAHLSFGVPLLFGVTGDLILIDQTSYMKISLFGPKYEKSEAKPGPSASAPAMDVQKAIDEVGKFLDQPGVSPTRQADEKCGDGDCYRVSLNLTSDQLASVTSALGTAPPSGTGTVDVWVQKNDLHPVKMTIAAEGGDQGTIAVTLTLSNYDAPLTINAPPDAEIAPAAT